MSTFLDPIKFAYRKHVGVDDAFLYMLHRIYGHLETAGSHVRIMFFDFSSAFNTIQPRILAKKLMTFKLHNKHCLGHGLSSAQTTVCSTG
ncbi:hypothetical protein LDENG_00064140 [Lucifuga dentata]|nr:hypothetical protein LDENG_00064140 [Lucifuga dentata]